MLHAKMIPPRGIGYGVWSRYGGLLNSKTKTYHICFDELNRLYLNDLYAKQMLD